MAQTVETIIEARWRQGKRFVYLANVEGLIAGAEANILVCVGNENIIVEGFRIEANVEKLSWEAFGGTQHTEGAGTQVKAIARNSAADTEPKQTLILNPTITNNGQSLTDQAVKIVAQIFRNNNYYLNDELISSDFSFMKNLCYLIKITNTSSAATDIQMTMNVSSE